jgi:tRNA-dihydrouridine synthase
MLQPGLTRELAEAISSASPEVPVSVKCRLGVHERASADGSGPEDSYEGLAEYVGHVTATGAVSHVIVHARAAILAGLSPGQNRRIPPLRPDWVLRLARDFPEIRVTLNGGVGSVARCRELAAGQIDGVMAGRWLLRRPLDLWDIDAEPTIRAAPGATGIRVARSRAAALTSFCAYAEQSLASRTASLSQLIPPLLLVVEQIREDLTQIDSERGADLNATSSDELLELLHVLWEGAATLIPGVEVVDRMHDMVGDVDDLTASARKLSKLLAKAMGIKVANKLLRNRAE